MSKLSNIEENRATSVAKVRREDDYFSYVSVKNSEAVAEIKSGIGSKRNSIAPDLEKLKQQKRNDSDCMSAFSKAISSVRDTKGRVLVKGVETASIFTNQSNPFSPKTTVNFKEHEKIR